MGKQTPGQRAWYERNRERQIQQTALKRKAFVSELAGIKSEQGCSVCGETDARCLDFHHLDRQDKEFNIATGLAKGYGRAKMLHEVAKCIVLCANCHRKEHAPVI